jgi:CRP-like cAMP-binding protein
VFAVSPTLEKLPNAIVLRLKRGEKIPCPRGDDTVFRVQDGVIGFHVLVKDGQESLVSLLGSGSYFGDRRQGGSDIRDAVATALTPAIVLRIERGDLLDHLASDRSAMEAYVARVAERNLESEAELCGHLFDTSEQRLRQLLPKLCRLGVMDEQGEVEVPMKLTHDMLAQMVGTTRSRVTFFMNKFRREGWVHYGRSLIIIPGKKPVNPGPSFTESER